LFSWKWGQLGGWGEMLLWADASAGKISIVICNQSVFSTVGALWYSNLFQHRRGFVAYVYALPSSSWCCLFLVGSIRVIPLPFGLVDLTVDISKFPNCHFHYEYRNIICSAFRPEFGFVWQNGYTGETLKLLFCLSLRVENAGCRKICHFIPLRLKYEQGSEIIEGIVSLSFEPSTHSLIRFHPGLSSSSQPIYI
jgi:hypothetical protein